MGVPLETSWVWLPDYDENKTCSKGGLLRIDADFGEFCSPTVEVSSLRLLAGFSCDELPGPRHFDIEHTFFQAIYFEDVFMLMPPGWGRRSGLIAELKKRLNGLGQAFKKMEYPPEGHFGD